MNWFLGNKDGKVSNASGNTLEVDAGTEVLYERYTLLLRFYGSGRPPCLFINGGNVWRLDKGTKRHFFGDVPDLEVKEIQPENKRVVFSLVST